MNDEMLDYVPTVQQLQNKVQQMHRAANIIYGLLVQCEVHPFIEFNGLMQKYVDMCRAAASAGVDFTMASTHTGLGLPLEYHDVEYLAEKFECIFGPSFKANPDKWQVFKKRMGLP